MAYEQILSQYANKNNVGTLWAQIVANFIHAAPAAKGDLLFWNAASQGGSGNTPTQPSHLTIGNAGDFLSVNNGVPVWTAFGTPSLAFSDTTTDAPKLAITIQGKTSTAVALPVADATHSGILTTGAQTIAGAKTFKETVHSEKDVEADGGVSAFGIADLSVSGGSGSPIVGIRYDNITVGSIYSPVDGIITLPKSADNITWTSTNQSLTQTQKTNLLALYDKAPSALWNSGNEIADKSFVNSSIATATATFRGTVTATDDTDAAAATALATITTKDLNDYAFVKVENTPNTGVDKYKRYKWNGSSWDYEYTLNNSSFTSDQWNAINSGITTSLVTDIGTLKGFFNMSTGVANNADKLDGYDSSYFAAASSLADYVTLATAQSITGAKTFASDNFGDVLIVKRNDTTLGQAIKFTNSSSVLGYLGFGTNGLAYWDYNAQEKKIWTETNDGSGSGLDADLLDGQHGSYYAVKADTENAVNVLSSAIGDVSSVAYDNKEKIDSVEDDVIELYGYFDGSSALHALSSTKLTTARTIWGQSFDGTANVSGAMSDVTSIDSLVYISSSKVGIGVSSPTAKLDISGGLKTTEDISGGQDIYAAGGVAAYGIADLAAGSGGGQGTVTSIKFEGGSTIYSPVEGIITLPAYPSLIGYATQTWVYGQISDLNLGTASTHDHGDYVTAVSISGTNLSVTKGNGSAVTSAINAATLEGTAKSGLFTALTTGTTNAIGITIGGTTKNITASDLRTSLNIGQHSDYVTALGVSGNTLTWSKGGVAQTAITVPYATNSDTVDTHHASEFVGALGTSGDDLTWTKIGGSANTLTVPYATTALDAKTELKEGQEFAFRQTGSGTLTKPYSSGVLKRVLGNTVVWNQNVHNGTFESTTGWGAVNGTISASGNILSFTYGGSGDGAVYYSRNYVPVVTHKYLIYGYINSSSVARFICGNGASYATGITEIEVVQSLANTMSKAYTYFSASSGNNMNTFFIRRSNNFTVKNVTLYDLTLMFGAGNEPTSVADFERDYGYLLANPEYNAGELINNACSGLETVGFNLWDEANGFTNTNINSTGDVTSSDVSACSNTFIPVVGGLSYCASARSSLHGLRIAWYDATYSFISRSAVTNISLITATSPASARYAKWVLNYDNTSLVTASIIDALKINFGVSDTVKNGTYEPYRKNTLPLNLNSFRVKDSQGNIITINGLKKAGSVYDEIVGRKFIQRLGSVDLGSLSWNKSPNYNFFFATGFGKKTSQLNVLENILSCRYVTMATSYDNQVQNRGDKTIAGFSGTNGITVVDSSYSDAATFKTAMNGVYLNYELATPIEYELIDDFPTTYPVDVLGTESIPEGEMVAPFKADIQYGAKQNDFAWDIDHLAGKVADMDISHYSSMSDSTMDTHVITIGGKKFYLKFRATQADTTSTPQTLPAFEIAVADNPYGQNEQEFAFGTITEDWITTNCVLPS